MVDDKPVAPRRRSLFNAIKILGGTEDLFQAAIGVSGTAASFDNPDHVVIVIHNYRWRLGLAQGEAQYDALEQRLAEGPVIAVPTITLEGDANGASHPDSSVYAAKFSGKYAH